MSLPNFTRQSSSSSYLNKNGFCIFLDFLHWDALFLFRSTYQNVIDQAEPTASIDTMIPAQYVLVPLQLDNAEFLKDLINQTAVVDLFANTMKKPNCWPKMCGLSKPQSTSRV